MTCAKAARAATALALAPLLWTAAPAQAYGLFGKKPPAAPTAAETTAAKVAAAQAALRPQKATPEQRAAIARTDPLARAAFWAREVDADPSDLDSAVRMTAALRALGRVEEAGNAIAKVLVARPDHVEALLEAGRVKIAGGQGFYALEFLNRAVAAAPRDWRPHSLLGVAMEQTKRPDDARAEYARALQLSPENPAVLSNLGLLAANTGDRVQAEALLRRAAAAPGATTIERQNLALVLGLAGKVGEAEQIIRRDLPPEVADANLAYLRAAAAPSR